MTLFLQLYLTLTLTAVLYALAFVTAIAEDRPGWFCFLGAMVVWAAFNLYAINQ